MRDTTSAVQFGCFWTNGQICSATSRLLLHRAIAPAFLSRLKARAESIRMCDPMHPGCRLGPLVCESQYKKVCQYIKDGIEEGATLLTGGAARDSHGGGSSSGGDGDGAASAPSRGYFVRPTVFTGVRRGMRIWREEIFGPVLAVMEFDTEAEAVALANESEFGLAGAVISDDAARCARVARALDAGIVWVNCSQPCFCQVHLRTQD